MFKVFIVLVLMLGLCGCHTDAWYEGHCRVDGGKIIWEEPITEYYTITKTSFLDPPEVRGKSFQTSERVQYGSCEICNKRFRRIVDEWNN